MAGTADGDGEEECAGDDNNGRAREIGGDHDEAAREAVGDHAGERAKEEEGGEHHNVELGGFLGADVVEEGVFVAVGEEWEDLPGFLRFSRSLSMTRKWMRSPRAEMTKASQRRRKLRFLRRGGNFCAICGVGIDGCGLDNWFAH